MTEQDRLRNLKDILARRVIGQETAVKTLADAVKQLTTGLKAEGRPFVTLFAGPSGTGKTELAKALSEVLFLDEDRLIRLDMTEYREAHHRDKFLGSPVGYVGSDETPPLVTAIRRQPYSVVLLDEIEKAHRDVLTVFMPVFDDGRLETAKGRVADFSHAIFILTSNLGTGFREERLGVKMGHLETDEERHERTARELDAQVRAAVEKHLLAEVRGRVEQSGGVVVFQPLSREAVHEILDLHLAKLNRRAGLTERDVELTLDASAKEFLVEKGYSTQYGARYLIQALERWVVRPLAQAFVEDKIARGAKVVCRRREDDLEFDFVTADGAQSIVLPPGDEEPIPTGD